MTHQLYRQEDIFSPSFVEQLFENMSGTYERMNMITSFGFSERWRRQCVEAIQLKPGVVIVDLMTGMGEAWSYILPKIERTGKLVAIDFCQAMLDHAERRKAKFPAHQIHISCENALQNSLPSHYADAVISTFGLKTLSPLQIQLLAQEIWRVLKPGGQFSLIEISKPRLMMLNIPFLLYLKVVIPFFGRLFLGDPETYRMLGLYTEKFGDCTHAKAIFEKVGFKIEMNRYFGGCASGLTGIKH
jgi:demethylmenaquinone methyltransferase/2-methoxy-6-polyprenyl-1,4-benzoquinol methylase